MVADEQLGVPLEDALGWSSQRMENRDLEQVALVAALQRETGGNTAEVLDRVDRDDPRAPELRRIVQTLTAQGRMSRWIVSLLPSCSARRSSRLNPDYIEPLFTTTAARCCSSLAAVLVVAGSLVIKKIVNIKV